MDNSKQVFTASMDLGTHVLTYFVAFAVGACVAGLVWGGFFVPYLWLTPAPVALTLPVAALFAPRKYIVTPTHVIIWCFGPNVLIPRDEISLVKQISIGGAYRTCGAGGFLGYWGWFWSKSLGKFRAYLTRYDNAVLIQNSMGEKVVVSPDDPDGFVELLNSVPLVESDVEVLRKPDEVRSMSTMSKIILFVIFAPLIYIIVILAVVLIYERPDSPISRAAGGSIVSDNSVFRGTNGPIDIREIQPEDDLHVVGTWKSVDIVNHPDDFVSDQPQRSDIKANKLVFHSDGRMGKLYQKWKGSYIFHTGDQSAAHYEIREINNDQYLFYEWVNGDVLYRGMKPKYYVLKK